MWAAPTTDARLKTRIVRTVIREVVADINDEASEIVLLIHWIGGVRTELRPPRKRCGQLNSTSADILATFRQLVLIANDDLITGILNRNEQAGAFARLAPKTLRLAAEVGAIEGIHPLPDGLWIFNRSTRGEPVAQSIVLRARQNPNTPHSLQQHRQMGVMKQDCTTRCASGDRTRYQGS